MIILADNDIIHKLACFDLLAELVTLLECDPHEIYVLPTLRFWLRKKVRNNPVLLARCDNFLASLSEAPVANAARLEQFATLDVGEQQLFAVMVEQRETCHLITGDKRALKVVGKLAAEDTALMNCLTGRVACLEGILLALIARFGFEAINTKISSYGSVDGVCGIAFGICHSQEHAEEALRSWLENLRREAPFVNSPHP